MCVCTCVCMCVCVCVYMCVKNNHQYFLLYFKLIIQTKVFSFSFFHFLIRWDTVFFSYLSLALCQPRQTCPALFHFPSTQQLQQLGRLSQQLQYMGRLSQQLQYVGRFKPATPVAQQNKPVTPVCEQTKPATPVAQQTKPATPLAWQAKPATPVARQAKPATPVCGQTKPATPVARQVKAAKPGPVVRQKKVSSIDKETHLSLIAFTVLLKNNHFYFPLYLLLGKPIILTKPIFFHIILFIF